MKILEVSYGTQRFWTPSERQMNMWAQKALGRVALKTPRSDEPLVACKVVSLAESRRLNRDFRGKDYSTNVLSFASDQDPNDHGFLGNLAICPAVLATEAREQKKALSAHWAHMLVHGTLHLLGFDHIKESDQVVMERKEIRILKSLGFPNPYRSYE